MMFFKVLYYFMGLIFMCVNFYKAFNIKKYRAFYLTLSEKLKKIKELDTTASNELVGYTFLFIIYVFFNLFWLLIGLFTFNYEYIIVFLGLTIILSKIFNRKGKMNIVYGFIMSILWAFFYLFLALNSFHFKMQLNLFENIKSFF